MSSFNSQTVATLAKKDLPTLPYVVENLITPGLSIFAGLGKIGKSWLIYWLIVKVAKGESVWNFNTTRGTTLYLAFEDNEHRLQDRFFTLFDGIDDAPDNAHLCIEPYKMGGELEKRIRSFVSKYPDTNLIAIDTLQTIREGKESSYVNDYRDITSIKAIADELQIAIIIVHHTRKMKDDDVFNEITGSTGIQGGCDNMFVLSQGTRGGNVGVLSCVGRDIPRREIELERGEDFVWKITEDSLGEQCLIEKRFVDSLLTLLNERGNFKTNPTELSALLSLQSGDNISCRMITKKINTLKHSLTNAGIIATSRRSMGKNVIEISHKSVDSVKNS